MTARQPRSIPSLNWLLMIGVIVGTLGCSNSQQPPETSVAATTHHSPGNSYAYMQGPSSDPTDDRLTDEDFERHLVELQERIPSSEPFHVVIEKPFVVVGNGGKDHVERWATGTVRWAVERLKKDYFDADPTKIIDIWLFKDKQTYERHTEAIFGSRPHTPFGYYSSQDQALIMNISTGGGTLVHEIVHPYIEANFAKCPAWFNEGLASLYEQSTDADGHIRGLTNWRLAGLQQAIQDESLPTLSELFATTTREFYTGRGDNYAQARYLCYYLQEEGQLVCYYQSFRDNIDDDPTGLKTLQQVLEIEDMALFEEEWRRFVMTLRFP